MCCLISYVGWSTNGPLGIFLSILGHFGSLVLLFLPFVHSESRNVRQGFYVNISVLWGFNFTKVYSKE